ncbi:MAG: hypothetical protein F6J99_06875 [Moorea sp. SIO4G3]|nr:hypothetical protein [Moorena sp. SIO4G3]
MTSLNPPYGQTGAGFLDSPFPITYYLLPITYYPLPITYYPLPITHYLFPIPHSPFPIPIIITIMVILGIVK